MTPVPRKIYLQLNNVPPCNFGALWSEERVNEEDVAYVLETDPIMQDKLDRLQELADLQHKVLCKRGAVVDELRKEIRELKKELKEVEEKLENYRVRNTYPINVQNDGETACS